MKIRKMMYSFVQAEAVYLLNCSYGEESICAEVAQMLVEYGFKCFIFI